ncbi:MAG: universal stress protein [Deltaproteobacteria bacterium HGW-Deltaproteobacteria-6]|jgi:nucleotide-binding universal stress UspA family protein|nr:MAG: universal stress protein [Deltaproteobacteria bacterium HGW-Deltaproteobacteria-6]
MIMFAPKKILVPTDFSVYADNAMKQAIDIALQNKAKIYLLHVIDDGFQQCAVDYCLNEGDVRKILEDSIKNAKEKLQQEAKKVMDGDSGIEIIYDTKRGIPYEEILKEQEEKGIDLIVIASHGKTGILSNLMGGVVDKVMKKAKCPVLLVRS